MNGDSIGDILVGDSGEFGGDVFVVFGSQESFRSAVDPYSLDGTDGFAFVEQSE
ncbi:MAG: hypothetical protein U1E59_05140 [Amaricoccus sp.]